jgi:hypothetical protein
MIARSAYIVFSQALSLADRPFLSRKQVRRAFRPIFANPNCISDVALHQKEQLGPVSKPFVRNLGLLRPHKAPYRAGVIFDREVEVEDERMALAHFGLDRPLFLKATSDGRGQAQGKLFIHLYPSGYIILHVALSISPHVLDSHEHLREAVVEGRPWNRHGNWTWSSRLGEMSLYRTLEAVKANLAETFLEEPRELAAQGKWRSMLRLVTASPAEPFGKTFFRDNYHVFDITAGRWRSEAAEFLLSSKQGIIVVLSPGRSRVSAQELFWKTMTMNEFVILKKQIYQDYAEFLRPEIINLRDYRLDKAHKLTNEDMRRLKVYDRRIPRYLYVLDAYTRAAKSFYRRLYVEFSNAVDLDKDRDAVKELVKEWQSEVEQWEHGLLVAWKKILGPLLSLFK